MSPKPALLSGAALLRAILSLKPIHTVKLIALDDSRGVLTAAQAHLVARCGEYEGTVKSGRVRFIRELKTNRIEWTPCWRNTEAAVCPPWNSR